MISTDACGQGSCLYGKTRDHVRALTMVLSDGTVWASAPLAANDLAAVAARTDRVGEIHRVVDDVVTTDAALIAERFPVLNRCLTGYDLAHVRHDGGLFDLNAVLCGSEGTLGLIAEAELSVLPIPRHAALINVRYDSFDAALRMPARSSPLAQPPSRPWTRGSSRSPAATSSGPRSAPTSPTTPRAGRGRQPSRAAGRYRGGPRRAARRRHRQAGP